MDGNVSVLISFAAGIATFVSPCLLPLLPAYISFITGSSLGPAGTKPPPLKNTLLGTIFFILGFTCVFTLLGASVTFLGGLLGAKKDFIRITGGIIIIIFGLHIAGVFRIPALYAEKRFHVKPKAPGGASSFLVGFFFAIGWTPCVGPILASILLLASTETTVGRGILLLAVYSLGLGVPFLLTALLLHKALHFLDKVKRHLRAISIISGIILVVTGILMITNRLFIPL